MSLGFDPSRDPKMAVSVGILAIVQGLLVAAREDDDETLDLLEKASDMAGAYVEGKKDYDVAEALRLLAEAAERIKL